MRGISKENFRGVSISIYLSRGACNAPRSDSCRSCPVGANAVATGCSKQQNENMHGAHTVHKRNKSPQLLSSPRPGTAQLAREELRAAPAVHSRVFAAAARGKPLRLYGSFDHSRRYVYVYVYIRVVLNIKAG